MPKKHVVSKYFVVAGVRSRIVPGMVWCNLSVFGYSFDAIARLLRLSSLRNWSIAPFRDVDVEVKYAFLGAGNADKLIFLHYFVVTGGRSLLAVVQSRIGLFVLARAPLRFIPRGGYTAMPNISANVKGERLL